MNKLSVFFGSFLLITPFLFAQEKPLSQAFPFNHYKLTSDSLMSAAKLNHPITEKDRIYVDEDGHLSADGQRIRIFGTNLTEFPTSHKQAEFSAKALANQGYNCIRFHHTDADWTHCFIKRTEDGRRILDKSRLDDFDYFFAQLKANGIYSNINFLTGRVIKSADGYKEETDSITESKTIHDLGFWDEAALNKQKEWASTLMNHVNPYTGLAYKDDPAVAIVEINNENGIIMGYFNGWLEQVKGEYWTELETQWNQWLSERGYSYDTLCTKFNSSSEITESLITRDSKWNLEQHQGAKARLSQKNNQTAITVEKDGLASWHIQYNCPHLSFTGNQIYTIKFSAKASKPSEIGVSLMEAHDPWQNSGFSANISLNNEWKNFEYAVSDVETDDNLRLNFGGMGLSRGTIFYFKDVTVTKGGAIEFSKKGRLYTEENKTIAMPHYEEYQSLPQEYKDLVMRFLWDKEEAYWLSMRDYVRNTLASKVLIMGTASGCSTTVIQSCFDIIDSHAYWNHPAFPGASWDMSNFYVKNTDLTKAGSNCTLLNLAKYRVYGKPFSVSEYDHPHPNQYASEDYPMLSSFGSFQDWDCIFTFCSELPKNSDGQNLRINGYFDQSNNPSKSCAAPVASRIFRQFLVKPADTKVSINLNKELEQSLLTKMRAWNVGNPLLFGAYLPAAYKYQTGIRLENVTPDSFQTTDVSQINKDEIPEIYKGFDQTCQLYWDVETGSFMVCNDNVAISVLSKDSSRPDTTDYPEQWQNCRLYPAVQNSDTDFLCVAAVRDILAENKPYLVFSCSWSGNKNENLYEYGKKFAGAQIFRESVQLTSKSGFSKGPALTLGSNAVLYSSGKEPMNIFKLGLDGNKSQKIEPAAAQSLWSYGLSSKDKTIWYLVE